MSTLHKHTQSQSASGSCGFVVLQGSFSMSNRLMHFNRCVQMFIINWDES